MLLFRTEYGSRAMGMGTEDSVLPEHADYDTINALLHDIYLEGWSQ